MLSVVELRDLCAQLAATLGSVSAELEAAQEGEWPLPESVGETMRERDAMAAAMKRLPEDVRGKLRTIYAAELAKEAGADYYGMSAPAFIGELERDADDALEDVRRARLRDAELHETISASERRAL